MGMFGTEKRRTLKPPPGKKLVRDWLGMRVKTLRDMENGWGVVAAGTVLTVDGTSPGRGLILKSDRCACCGVRTNISGVFSHDVDLVIADQESSEVVSNHQEMSGEQG